MRVEAYLRIRFRTSVQHRGAHQAVPKECGPVVWSRTKSLLIQEGVITGRERVVKDCADPMRCQGAKFVQIAKGIDESRSPFVSTACRLCGLRHPDRLPWHVAITQAAIEGIHPFRNVKKVHRKSLFRRCASSKQTATARGKSIIEVVGVDIEYWSRGTKQLLARNALHHSRLFPSHSFAFAAWTEKSGFGVSVAEPIAKGLVISGVCCRRIPIGHATGSKRKCGLVHELSGRNLPADRLRVLEEVRGLRWSPNPLGVTRSGAGSDRRHGLSVHRFRKLDDTIPLRTRKYAGEARR